MPVFVFQMIKTYQTAPQTPPLYFKQLELIKQLCERHLQPLAGHHLQRGLPPALQPGALVGAALEEQLRDVQPVGQARVVQRRVAPRGRLVYVRAMC